jgi:hypothetical protein
MHKPLIKLIWMMNTYRIALSRLISVSVSRRETHMICRILKC